MTLLKPNAAETMGLAIQEAYDRTEWSPEELNLPAEYEGIHLDTVEEVSGIIVVDVRRLPDDRRLVSVEARLVCNFDVFIYKRDYPFVQDDPRLSIVNPYWNSRYMRGEISLPFQSVVRLILDNLGYQQREMEVLSVEPIIPDNERLDATHYLRYHPPGRRVSRPRR